jgi:hypothetical protein
MNGAVSWSHRPEKEFDTSNDPGFMFKVMHLPDIPLFDNLFPPAGSQPP